MIMNSGYESSQYILSALECMENLVDGVMLVGYQGEVLYMNHMADQICQNLSGEKTAQSTKAQSTKAQSAKAQSIKVLPEVVWHTCQTLIEPDRTGDQSTQPDRTTSPAWVSSEAEIQSYRVRVQRFQLKRLETPCFIVRLEDQQQSLCHRVMAEIQQYGLTSREAEVWRLKRENLSRQEIANQLFISVDTVKKHLCNIQLKRQSHGDIPQSA